MAVITQDLQDTCGQLEIMQDALGHLKEHSLLMLKLLKHAPDSNGNLHT